jgi:hypothetical protein
MCVTTTSSAHPQSSDPPRGHSRARVLDMRSPRCGAVGPEPVSCPHDTPLVREQANNVTLDSRLSSHTPTVVIGAWHPAAHSTTRARPRPRWSSSTNSMASRPYKLPPAAALSPSPNRSSSFNTCTSLTYVRFLDSLSHQLAKPSDHLVVSPPPDSKAPRYWSRPARVPKAHVGHAPAPTAAAWACVRVAPTPRPPHPWAF